MIYIYFQTVTTLPPMVLQLDLSDLKSIPSKMNYVLDVFKHVDILINNGGVSHRGDVLTTDIDVDIKVMLVNYFGMVALTKGMIEWVSIFISFLIMFIFFIFIFYLI